MGIKRITNVWFLIILCGFIFLFNPGCGKKGPPLPPLVEGQKIAAPFDLAYKIVDQKVTLSWKHEIDRQKAAVKPAGFEIFMAQKTFETCEGCPFEFKPAGFVSMPDKVFIMALEKGNKYYFRVQAAGEENMRSDVSKTVQFEYK